MQGNSRVKQKHKKKLPQDADSMASQELSKNDMTNEKETETIFPKFVFKRRFSEILSNKKQSRQHDNERGNEPER